MGWSMGAGDAGGDEEPLLADINVTPLVDVVLVLLVIFMVTAPLMTPAVDVHLPEITTASPAPQERLVIVLGSDGTIGVDDHIVTLDEAVRLALAATRAGEVLLRADRDVPYGYVMSVFDALSQAGIDRLALPVERIADEVPPAKAPPGRTSRPPRRP